jgi:hypothetical protein
MIRRVFIDTAWKSKKHTYYDPQNDIFFEVARREIVDKAIKVIPRFMDIVDSLGLIGMISVGWQG